MGQGVRNESKGRNRKLQFKLRRLEREVRNSRAALDFRPNSKFVVRERREVRAPRWLKFETFRRFLFNLVMLHHHINII